MSKRVIEIILAIGLAVAVLIVGAAVARGAEPTTNCIITGGGYAGQGDPRDCPRVPFLPHPSDGMTEEPVVEPTPEVTVEPTRPVRPVVDDEFREHVQEVVDRVRDKIAEQEETPTPSPRPTIVTDEMREQIKERVDKVRESLESEQTEEEVVERKVESVAVKSRQTNVVSSKPAAQVMVGPVVETDIVNETPRNLIRGW